MLRVERDVGRERGAVVPPPIVGVAGHGHAVGAGGQTIDARHANAAHGGNHVRHVDLLHTGPDEMLDRDLPREIADPQDGIRIDRAGRIGLGAVAVAVLEDPHVDRERRVGIDLGVEEDVGFAGRGLWILRRPRAEAAVERGLDRPAALAVGHGPGHLLEGPDERVIAGGGGAAPDHVAAEAGIDLVVAGAALDPVVAGSALDDVVAVTAEDQGVAAHRHDPVATRAAREQVVARAAFDFVGLEAAADPVGTLRAHEQVVAGPAFEPRGEGVDARRTGQCPAPGAGRRGIDRQTRLGCEPHLTSEDGREVADGVARCLDADLLAEGVEEVAIGAAPEEVGSGAALDQVGVACAEI